VTAEKKRIDLLKQHKKCVGKKQLRIAGRKAAGWLFQYRDCL
jgi:hypothetical protein